MSGLSFRSVFMVASCAGAALSCYLVSLHVASERAALEQVERQIVTAEREIRLLETEIGTRGRLAQLERWNVRVLALSAPTADQFLDGGFQLASLMQPQRRIELEAPVVLASADADDARPQLAGIEQKSEAEIEQAPDASDLLHVASLKRSSPKRDSAAAASVPKAAAKKAGDKPSSAASDSMTKTVKTAKVDPLAPLSGATQTKKTSKDADSVR